MEKLHYLRGNFLLVTADEKIRKKIRFDMKESLLNLYTALTMEEAFGKLAAHSIDIVLVDITIPMALRFLARLNLRYQDLYCIVVTNGHNRNAVKHILTRKLAKKIINKPIRSNFIKNQAPNVLLERNIKEFKKFLDNNSSILKLPCSRKIYPSLGSMVSSDRTSIGSLANVLQNDIAITTSVLNAFFTDDEIRNIDITEDMLDNEEQKDGFREQEPISKIDALNSVTKKIEIDVGTNDRKTKIINDNRKLSSITHALMQMMPNRLQEILDSLEVVENYTDKDYYHFRKISLKAALIRRYTPFIHRALYNNIISNALDLPLYFIDIGKFVQFAYLPEQFYAIIKYMDVNRGMGYYSAEIELGLEGHTHADIGSILLDKWGFPPIYSMCAKHHHKPRWAKQNLKTILSAAAYTETFVDFVISQSLKGKKGIDLTKYKYFLKFHFYDLNLLQKKITTFILENEWL